MHVADCSIEDVAFLHENRQAWGEAPGSIRKTMES